MNSETPKLVTYAFVDAANIIYRDPLRDPWKIDMKNLIEYLRERFGTFRILYFGGVDIQNRVQIRLHQKMRTWGYELYLNPIKRFVNEQGKSYVKADVDSHMTFEMMRLFPEYDRAVVLTGDGDFYWVLEYLFQKKEKIWLLANPNKTARELKKLVGGNFSNLNNLRSQLEFHLTTQNEADSTNDSASGIYRHIVALRFRLSKVVYESTCNCTFPGSSAIGVLSAKAALRRSYPPLVIHQEDNTHGCEIEFRQLNEQLNQAAEKYNTLLASIELLNVKHDEIVRTIQAKLKAVSCEIEAVCSGPVTIRPEQ